MHSAELHIVRLSARLVRDNGLGLPAKARDLLLGVLFFMLTA